jgi:hypothetical protein
LKKGVAAMTTRDEEKKRRRKLAKRAHLQLLSRGLKETRARVAQSGLEENQDDLVTIVIRRVHLARMVHLAEWGHRARQGLQGLAWLLFSFALVWGLLATLRAFLR